MKAKLLLAIAYCCLLGSCQTNEQSNRSESLSTADTPARIISLSGFITEVLYELGLGDQIVGTDITSTYPEAVEALPKLGHTSQLNAEALLALRPDVILIESRQAGNQVLQQIANSGIRILEIPTSFRLDNALQAARVMQQHLDISDQQIEKLGARIDQDRLQLENTLSQFTEKPKVLFIYARGAGRLQVAGRNTSAAAIIELAGGQNAINTFDNFQVLTPEALVGAAPDVILMFSSGLASLDGRAGLAQIPGMTQTPAFQHDRIVTMDGHYLTAFGPRAGEAAETLARAIRQKTNL